MHNAALTLALETLTSTWAELETLTSTCQHQEAQTAFCLSQHTFSLCRFFSDRADVAAGAAPIPWLQQLRQILVNDVLVSDGVSQASKLIMRTMGIIRRGALGLSLSWIYVRAGFLLGTCSQKETTFMQSFCEPGVAGQRYAKLVSKETEKCKKQVGNRFEEECLCGLYLKNLQMYFPLVPVGLRWENKTSSLSLFYPLQLNRALSSTSQSTQDRRTKQERKKEVMQKIKNLRRQHKLKKERMSEEDKMVWRLQKTNRKIAIFHQKLKKYDLPEDEASQHDPEIVTQEQLQALKKIGYKNKNYVPVGRRGIYGGTIQNMHMHWKKHETVQVDCHVFSKERIKSMAQELARLSGGIVIDIHQATTVILYRGKNYRQPKVLIPPNLLDKRKALFKSKYEQALDSLEEHARKVEKELAKLRTQKFKADAKQLTETKGSATWSQEKIESSLEEDDERKEASDEEGFDAWPEDEYELYEPSEGCSEAESDAELDFSESSELKER